MKKIIYILFFVLLLACALTWYFWPQPETHLRQAAFTDLPGWNTTDASQSLAAFQISCKAFLKQDPEKPSGSQFIKLKIKDWHPACKAALSVKANSAKEAKAFFERWFTPYMFFKDKPVQGLFTGYYLPLVKGSLKRSERFNTPIYDVPDNLITVNLGAFDPDLLHHRKLIGRLKGKQLVPYYTRAEISEGAIDKHAKVLVWIEDEVERQFLEIEGSGIIELPHGEKIHIGYAAENGAPYTALAKVLIDQGVMTRDNASMQRIRAYFKEHPEQIRTVLNHNRSFVFFNLRSQKAALGSQGVGLTAGYSLAVDRRWLPMGVPLWLNTTHLDDHHQKQIDFQRLMIAQDTGGAIKGPVRGDVFWGAGEKAISIAGHMKNPGYYWVFLPNKTEH